ncbi:MAG: hypothetical protein ACXV79_10725 [Methylobacter sp.]
MSTIESKEDVKLGAFSVSKALFHLYETAAPHLSKAEIELIARATEHAQLEAENLSEISGGLATLMANDESGSWDWKHQTPRLLWQMSYSLDAIAGMIELGTSAAYQLEHPEMYTKST